MAIKNPLQLNVQTLPGLMPAAGIMKYDELAERERINENINVLLCQANADAARIRQEADNILCDAHSKAEKLMIKTQEETESLQQKAKEQAVSEAIVWLCDVNEIERSLIDELEGRWCCVLAEVLEALLGQQNQNELLLNEIQRKMKTHYFEGQLIVTLPPGVRDLSAKLWGENNSVTLREDPLLREGQATIENDLVKIRLDLPEQQNQILAALKADPHRKKPLAWHTGGEPVQE